MNHKMKALWQCYKLCYNLHRVLSPTSVLRMSILAVNMGLIVKETLCFMNPFTVFISVGFLTGLLATDDSICICVYILFYFCKSLSC